MSTPVLVKVTNLGISGMKGEPSLLTMDVVHGFSGRKGGIGIFDEPGRFARYHHYWMLWRKNHFDFPYDALVFDDEVRWK